MRWKLAKNGRAGPGPGRLLPGVVQNLRHWGRASGSGCRKSVRNMEAGGWYLSSSPARAIRPYCLATCEYTLARKGWHDGV